MKLNRFVETASVIVFCAIIAIGFNPTETMAEELLTSGFSDEESTELLEIENSIEVPMLGGTQSGEGWTFDDATGTLTITADDVPCPFERTSDNPGRKVKSLVIKDGVTSIGISAFSGCSSLTSVTIPDSVTSIGRYAFAGCSSLTSVTIPNSVTSIENYAFAGCSSLTSVTIPNSVTSIEQYAFYECSSLTSVTIPNSVTSVEQHAFYECSSLTSIIIPNSVTSIGEAAFMDCSSLTSVTISNSVTSIGSSAFADCSNMKTVLLSDSITQISNNVFAGCSSLEQITIPSHVTYIYKDSFDYCCSLCKVENLSNCKFALPSYGGLRWYNIKNKSVPIAYIKNGTAVREDYNESTPTPNPEPTNPMKRFSDVPAGKWYSETDGPIAYVIANGIMNGTDEGTTFNPEGNCTREMVVQILYNAEEKPASGGNNPFSDVTSGKWYTNAVIWAYENGVTSGTSATTFGLGGNVTREQMAQFLMNYAKKRGFDIAARADLSGFPDAAQVLSWAKDAMSWANANGIINGKAKQGVNYLSPKGNATRDEVAQMIMNFQKKFGGVPTHAKVVAYITCADGVRVGLTQEMIDKIHAQWDFGGDAMELASHHTVGELEAVIGPTIH